MIGLKLLTYAGVPLVVFKDGLVPLMQVRSVQRIGDALHVWTIEGLVPRTAFTPFRDEELDPARAETPAGPAAADA